eukprot:SAG11_NODE_2047_length_3884_cov_1.573844_4_plen_75_part_00
MLRTMSVAEICHFSAGMRLPPTFNQAQISKVAETVIDVLGMSHIRDSKIGDESTRGIRSESTGGSHCMCCTSNR